MIDNFEMMGESEDGKFDLNAIFQRLMDKKREGEYTDNSEGDSEQGQIQSKYARAQQQEDEGLEGDEEQQGFSGRRRIEYENARLQRGEGSDEQEDDDEMSYETLRANFERACELLEEKDAQVFFCVLTLIDYLPAERT